MTPVDVRSASGENEAFPMNAARKAAILLLSLDKALAAQILGLLPRDQVESATYAVASAENVTLEEQSAVLREFKQLFQTQPLLQRGGPETAKELLEQSLGDESASPVQIRPEASFETGPFAFLRGRHADDIRSAMQEEHPQTMAVIAAQLPPAVSAMVLADLAPDLQAEVLQRVAKLGPTDPDVLNDVAAGLKERLGRSRIRSGGVSKAADVLRESPRVKSRSMLSALDQHDSDLADELRQTLFSFDDLLKLDDETLRVILQETDDHPWALALKASPEAVRQRVLGCLSNRVARALKDEMDSLGPVRLSEMTTVRQQIADSIRRLEDQGIVALPVRQVNTASG